jgi:hypothetical protein
VSSMNGEALRRLIDDTEKVNGQNDGDVEAWANRGGERRITTKDISAWRNNGMATLVPAKIHALADGLRISPGAVAVAVLADMGIEVEVDARTPEAAVRADLTLPAGTRDAVLSVLASARATPPPERPRRTRKRTRDGEL